MKLFIALLICVVLVGSGIAFFMLRGGTAPEGNPGGSNGGIFGGSGSGTGFTVNADAQEDIESSFEASMPNGERFSLENAVTSGSYALTIFTDENVGGMALFKRNASGAWDFVATDGGFFSVETLVSLGVPESDARILLRSFE